MNLRVRRFGGFAGLDETLVEIDTARRSETDRARTEGEIRELAFFSLPTSGADEAVGADLVYTEVTVRDGAESHTVRYSDENAGSSQALRRFVDRVVGDPKFSSKG
jgi:archaellin